MVILRETCMHDIGSNGVLNTLAVVQRTLVQDVRGGPFVHLDIWAQTEPSRSTFPYIDPTSATGV